MSASFRRMTAFAVVSCGYTVIFISSSVTFPYLDCEYAVEEILIANNINISVWNFFIQEILFDVNEFENNKNFIYFVKKNKKRASKNVFRSSYHLFVAQ